MDMIMKIWRFLSGFPMLANAIMGGLRHGKIDPNAVLDGAVTIDPNLKGIADMAKNSKSKSEFVEKFQSQDSVNVLGANINPRTLSDDLRKKGGFFAMAADMYDNMINLAKQGNDEDINTFAEMATDPKNWK